MFKSSSRDLIVPQSEHARLAGLMAFHWGNQNFAKSNLPFESFVKGVAFHDRGYPRLDNFPINGMPENEWLKILKQGAELDYSDLEANVIILMQIRRVALYNRTPEREKFANEITLKIDKLIAQSFYLEEDFLFADQITAFCDSVSYQFCFEQSSKLELELRAKPEDKEASKIKVSKIKVQFEKNGLVKISPWPFSIKNLSGYLNAYASSTYPDKLDPSILSFSISPA